MDSVVVAMTIAKTGRAYFSAAASYFVGFCGLSVSRIDPLVGFEMLRIGTVIVEPEFSWPSDRPSSFREFRCRGYIVEGRISILYEFR